MKRLFLLVYMFLQAQVLAIGQTAQDTAELGRIHRITSTVIIEILTADSTAKKADSIARQTGDSGAQRRASFFKARVDSLRRLNDSLSKVQIALINRYSGNNVSRDTINKGNSAEGSRSQNAQASMPSDINWLVLFFTGLVGMFVGLSELVNRYKSFKRVFVNFYSLSYMGLNFLAAVLFYWIVIRYQIDLGPFTKHTIGLIITCGLGAMAFLRSSFFNYRDTAGKIIEVGPAAMLTIFLRAAERQFDQCLADGCIEDVGALMDNKDLSFISASKDLPLLVLSCMQVLSDDEQKQLSEEILKLVNDTNTTVDVKKLALGAILLKYTGKDLLEKCVKKLIEIYKAQPKADLAKLDIATKALT